MPVPILFGKGKGYYVWEKTEKTRHCVYQRCALRQLNPFFFGRSLRFNYLAPPNSIPFDRSLVRSWTKAIS